MDAPTVRTRTVIAGLSLIAIPTLYTMFPGLVLWERGVRELIFAVWVLLAFYAGLTATRRDERIADFFGGEATTRHDVRSLAGSVAIRAVLNDLPPKLKKYDWRVFIYDAELDRLLPSYEPNSAMVESEGWDVGCGATGQAFKVKTYVSVRGVEVSDASYGLTQEQQRRYQHLEVVAAYPLKTFRNKPIGVLTASSEHDDGSLTSPDGQSGHIEAATVIARLLVDVLKLAAD